MGPVLAKRDGKTWKPELPCEYASKVVIPSIRALIVKKLVEEYKMSRYKAAKLLGLTPAAVTYYLNGERGKKLVKQIESRPELVKIIDELSRLIAGENGIKSLETYRQYKESICKVCSEVNEYAKMAGCPETLTLS
jgi:predicted transcriptional regulator